VHSWPCRSGIASDDGDDASLVDLPQSFSELFLDYFRLLFARTWLTPTHRRSGPDGISRRSRAVAKARATELLAEHLDGSLRLATVASQCGLSVSHFAKAFRQSVFETPAHANPVKPCEQSPRRALRGALPLMRSTGRDSAFENDCRTPSRNG